MGSRTEAINAAILAGYSVLESIGDCQLSYKTFGPITCYKSEEKTYNRKMTDTVFSNEFDDVFLLVKSSLISTWNLKPISCEVTVDGMKYLTGNTITECGPITKIYLRKKV